MPMPACAPAWQTSFPICMCSTCGETSELKGERSRQEGGKIFGSGSRTPVAIMVLVRDSAHKGECQIHYKDIGDYLSREEKLQNHQRRAVPLPAYPIGSESCRMNHHDWLDQRDPAYQAFMPLGKEGKSKKLEAKRLAILYIFLGSITARRCLDLRL